MLYKKYQDCGYTVTKTHLYQTDTGEQRTQIQTQWTNKGRKFIYDLLKKYDIVPVSEREHK